MPDLLLAGETRLHGDSAYRCIKQRTKLKEISPRARDFICTRNYRNTSITVAERKANYFKLVVGAKVKHPFLFLKRQWGFAKICYRALAKSANRAFAMLALINRYRWVVPLTEVLRPA